MDRHPQLEVFQAVAARLGEGVCWHPTRQAVWWIDIVGRRFYEASPAGGPPRAIECSQMIGAIAPTRRGGLVAALHDGIYLLDPLTGGTTPFAAPREHDARRFRFNDAKVDPAGRFWAGTLALDFHPGDSRLYRIDPDRSTCVMREGVSISNGLAWSPDGRMLYYIDSPTRSVQAFEFDREKGTIGAPRIVVSFAEADGLPDGCAMDAEGHLWVAHWGGAKITRWDVRHGRLLRTVALPVRHVTSCAFGGPRRDRLYITTAFGDSPTPEEPEAGYVFQIDPQTVGPELAGFAGD